MVCKCLTCLLLLLLLFFFYDVTFAVVAVWPKLKFSHTRHWPTLPCLRDLSQSQLLPLGLDDKVRKRWIISWQRRDFVSQNWCNPGWVCTAWFYLPWMCFAQWLLYFLHRRRENTLQKNLWTLSHTFAAHIGHKIYFDLYQSHKNRRTIKIGKLKRHTYKRKREPAGRQVCRYAAFEALTLSPVILKYWSDTLGLCSAPMDPTDPPQRLHISLSHPENTGSDTRMLFIYNSASFNMIIPDKRFSCRLHPSVTPPSIPTIIGTVPIIDQNLYYHRVKQTNKKSLIP